ncbi:TPM domain-containing protein [Edaphobacter albus]|uniref:TPM domain-containing protein n=1 Tax=Edaphobacter sp. 4G125 TaxID=2763071 RepID=UPI001645A4EB|nr:TPM domain-containing protein [Edaphobacter sp. 4G125]QNI35391.1 TPM domain-containing protein [Edaphobacter sp. 4G125]
MNRITRWLGIVVLLVLPLAVSAESVKSLPAPTGYINDFAGVLSPATKQQMETLCSQVDRQAHAQIAVVTIKTLDDDQTIEEFATELEDKWGVGNKDDRGVLMVLVMHPRRGRIEVGYGLEGILNDAKVGDIGRSMVPAANQGDYDTAVPLGVRQLASIIAADAGVALTIPGQQYRRQPVREEPTPLSLTQVLIGGGVILLLLFFLARTGNLGLIFFLLGNIMGGGRGGYYRGGGDDRDGWGGGGGGGGFGGFGGGRSGGGGASF